jgi:hypothetical protein
MIFNKKSANTILPTSSTDCFSKNCVNLYMNKNYELSPFKVTEIEFDLIIDVPEGYIIKIINHTNNFPWQILTSYVNYSQNELKLPITSCSNYTLKTGDIVCHLQIQTIEEAYSHFKSKFFIF